MGSSLQQGINAAKAGKMDKAMGFLKDAIIEEPQNADVWVWIAAIIDDVDKQEIFLQKALAINPHNIPAQRGLTYLQKRKKDEASVRGDHLSDHTSPISPFPPQAGTNKRPPVSEWSKLDPDDFPTPPNPPKDIPLEREKPRQFIENMPELTPFEIILLGVVVVVFGFIGILAASAIFDFDLPLRPIFGSRPVLKTEPPYPGVFLYEEGIYFDIKQHEGAPTHDLGIPTSFVTEPVIVLWQKETRLESLNLIYETGEYMPIVRHPEKGTAILIEPEQGLDPGLYCLQQPSEKLDENDALYWCFKIAASDIRQ